MENVYIRIKLYDEFVVDSFPSIHICNYNRVDQFLNESFWAWETFIQSNELKFQILRMIKGSFLVDKFEKKDAQQRKVRKRQSDETCGRFQHHSIGSETHIYYFRSIKKFRERTICDVYHCICMATTHTNKVNGCDISELLWQQSKNIFNDHFNAQHIYPTYTYTHTYFNSYQSNVGCMWHGIYCWKSVHVSAKRPTINKMIYISFV